MFFGGLLMFNYNFYFRTDVFFFFLPCTDNKNIIFISVKVHTEQY
jgi:hypothetical protein